MALPPSERCNVFGSSDLEQLKPEKAHILVVDDELLARESLGALLEDEDYEVSLASDGKEAITILKRHAISVLCTDFQMPGMNGIELVERAAHLSPGTVSVLVTAYPDYVSDSDRIDAVKHKLLVKPFKPDSVIRILAQAVRFSRIRGHLGTVPEHSKRASS